MLSKYVQQILIYFSKPPGHSHIQYKFKLQLCIAKNQRAFNNNNHNKNDSELSNKINETAAKQKNW